MAESLPLGYDFLKKRTAHSIGYVPDFFFISELANRTYLYLQDTKLFGKSVVADQYGFSYYIALGCLYHCLRCISRHGKQNQSLTRLLINFEKCGVNEFMTLPILRHWYEGVGHFKDTITMSNFIPILPPLRSQADIKQDGFISHEASTLWPNFRGMLSKIIALQTVTVGQRNSRQPLTLELWRTSEDLGLTFTGHVNKFGWINDELIPFQNQLTKRHINSDLLTYFTDSLALDESDLFMSKLIS